MTQFRLNIAALLLAALILLPGMAFGENGAVLHLRVSGDDKYIPYVYVNDDGNPTGFSVDIFKAVAEVMGIEAAIDLAPWTEARARLERGTIDVIIGMFRSIERESLVDFSHSHLTVTHSLFVRHGSTIRSLRDIEGKSVIVQDGDIMHDYLIEQKLPATIVTCASLPEGLRLLASGKYDGFLGATLQGLKTAQTYRLTNIGTVGPPMLPLEFCFAVKKGDRATLELLNEGLAIIFETGQYDRIYHKWFGSVTPSEVTLMSAVRRTFYTIILPIFAILIALGLWLWSLKRQVRRKTAELRNELAEHRKTEEALRLSEDTYRTLFETSRDALGFARPDGIVIDVNQAWLDLFGYTREETIGHNVRSMIYFDPAERDRFRDALVNHGFVRDFEITLRKKTGERMTCLVTANVRRAADGAILYFQTNTRDITRQRLAEQKFSQAQKMESVGRLAGGVAHDFNNLLTVIIGNAELAMTSIDSGHPLNRELMEIKATGERAAVLVRRLLTFSRTQKTDPRIISLNTVILDMENHLRRLVGGSVTLSFDLDPGLWPVFADSLQIEQALANLVVNASDAMPEGGTCIIATANVAVDYSLSVTLGGIAPGDYAALSVNDTGVGIPSELKDKIFEPFFSTKEDHMGDGLGLSTCFGIARQNNGAISVASEPGEGARFTIYLPRVSSGPGISALPTSPQAAAGQETILLVEEERTLRDMIAALLTKTGYTVITAASGEEALERVAVIPPPTVDLLLTGFRLAGIDGIVLAGILETRVPGLKTVFMSGSEDDRREAAARTNLTAAFLRKPFESAELYEVIRTVLNRNREQDTTRDGAPPLP